MKKILSIILASSLSASLMAPIMNVKAAELTPQSTQSVVNQKNTLKNRIITGINQNKKLKSLVKNLVISNDTITYTDSKTGKLVKIVYDENENKSTIYENGTINVLTKDNNDNVYLNGNLVVKAVKSKQNKEITPDDLQYVTTFYTQLSYYEDESSAAIGLMSLMGGPFGVAMGIIGVGMALVSPALPNEYIEIDQYYNEGDESITDYSYYYRNSDYTGYIDSDTDTYYLEF
ncbi:hypothetical protein [Clostridium hydrogenum]|uniref:hypothetical protein n=1 Tax=Clostridium hydrogenum TaxID=2855764 RepID=UPI001F1ACF28|nr:hypothetical protein [Clostridium hydrogenum]